MSEGPAERDLNAGAYVMGVLEPHEAHALEMQADQDPALAAAIDGWRTRLAPLAGAIRPMPPPQNLWRRIEISLGFASIPVVTEAAPPPRPEAAPAEAPLRRRLRFWRLATLAAFALTAGSVWIAFTERQAPPQLLASLMPADAPKPVFLARLESDGGLLIRPLRPISVQPGKDLELWALTEADPTPKSLGVLPAIGRRLTVRDRLPGTQLLISLEPADGSPTGAPTGPVLYSGALEPLN